MTARPAEYLDGSPVHTNAGSGSIKMRVSPADASYMGGIAAGSKILGLFADVETEISLKSFGNEGLCAGYDFVNFIQPVKVGDFIEARGEVTGNGNTSLKVTVTLYRLISVDARGNAGIEHPPVVIAEAQATIVPART